jgi:hypothetical protein
MNFVCSACASAEADKFIASWRCKGVVCASSCTSWADCAHCRTLICQCEDHLFKIFVGARCLDCCYNFGHFLNRAKGDWRFRIWTSWYIGLGVNPEWCNSGSGCFEVDLSDDFCRTCYVACGLSTSSNRIRSWSRVVPIGQLMSLRYQKRHKNLVEQADHF